MKDIEQTILTSQIWMYRASTLVFFLIAIYLIIGLVLFVLALGFTIGTWVGITEWLEELQRGLPGS